MGEERVKTLLILAGPERRSDVLLGTVRDMSAAVRVSAISFKDAMKTVEDIEEIEGGGADRRVRDSASAVRSALEVVVSALATAESAADHAFRCASMHRKVAGGGGEDSDDSEDDTLDLED